jgi:hypothetical protein
MDRLGNFLLGRDSKGMERLWLNAARPPWPVRFGFLFAFITGVTLALYLLADLLGWLPDSSGNPAYWRLPALAVCGYALQFARDEVFMHYGKRALRAQQDGQ